jgi:hypothetical protein
MARAFLIGLVLPLLLTGCGADRADTSPATAEAAPTQSASAAYDPSLTACDLLTPEMVSAEAGVEASAIERTYSSRTSCHYEWEGGKAEIQSVAVAEGADRARQGFEMSYREMSAEEAERASEAIAAEVARRQEAGEVSAEQAELASGLGGAASGEAARKRWVPVEGLGDRALYAGEVRPYQPPGLNRTFYGTSSELAVLHGNLRFEVHGYAAAFDASAPPPPGVVDQNRDFSVALARRVLAAR